MTPEIPRRGCTFRSGLGIPFLSARRIDTFRQLVIGALRTKGKSHGTCFMGSVAGHPCGGQSGGLASPQRPVGLTLPSGTLVSRGVASREFLPVSYLDNLPTSSSRAQHLVGYVDAFGRRSFAEFNKGIRNGGSEIRRAGADSDESKRYGRISQCEQRCCDSRSKQPAPQWHRHAVCRPVSMHEDEQRRRCERE